MILQHLASLVRLVFVFHCLRPNASCHTSYHTIFWIHPVAEEEGKIRCKIVDAHTPAQVIFNISESIGKRKCKLCDWISTCFSNMISTDAYAIEIANFIPDEIFLHITHQLQCK